MTTEDLKDAAAWAAGLVVHPLADAFPLVEGREFTELVEDIRRNGLRTPVLLDREGRILDGRNRLRACRAAGVEPRFETWDGPGTAAELIVSLNLRRRHLNESQRAMLGARLAQEIRKSLKQRKLQDGSANWQTAVTADEAAAQVNVSPRSVARALRLLESGDEKLIRKVESGKVAVSAAGKAARKPKGKSKELPAEEALAMLWGPVREVARVVKRLEGKGIVGEGQCERDLDALNDR